MRNKTLFILIGLLSSLSAQAGVYQCKPDTVSVPCAASRWMFGGDALYLQPAAGSLFVNGFGAQIQSYNMSPAWAFKISAAYFFGKANDFNINWTYFNTSEQMVDNQGVKYNQGGAGTVFDDANKFSVVNLELGQHIDVGEFWDMRFHLGMQIANTKDRDTATRSDNRALVSDTLKINMVGARAGLNLDYTFYEAFKLYVNGALGLLYAGEGLHHSTQGIFVSNTGFPTMTINQNRNQTAIAVDYTMGLSYHYALCQGDLTTNVGWTAYHWSVSTFSQIGYQGLLFGLNWKG